MFKQSLYQADNSSRGLPRLRRIYCSCTRIVKQFAADNRGNVAMLFATLMIPTIGLVGASIDYSNAVRIRAKMAATIDAAALAAGSAVNLSDAQRKQLAKDYISANFDTPPGTTMSEPSINISDSTITIDYAGSMPTSIIGVLGFDTVPIAASTEVNLKNTKLELALVLDTTGSMAWDNKINTLQTATWDLIDTLYAPEGSKDKIKIGIVPFNWFVKGNTNWETKSWLTVENEICDAWGNCTTPAWDGCILPRSGTGDLTDAKPTSSDPLIGRNCTGMGTQDMPVERMMSLTTNETALKNKANALFADGGTYIPAGLAWGWKVLSPVRPYKQGTEYSDTEWVKAIVLMTDGINDPNGDPLWITQETADTNTATLCQNIKDEGITIYTVAFQISDTDTKSLIQNCASKEAYYYDAGSNAALEAAFASITEQLSQLRLSK